MTRKTLLASLVLGSALTFSACSTIGDLPSERIAEAQLNFANGLPAGTAQLISNGQTLTLAAVATGLEPGEHGFHLHTTGKCEAPGFTSAGGHLNPAGREHGSLNPQGKHLGDLPNLVVGASRTTRAEVDLGEDSAELRAKLFDADGTAIVIHAAADDYTSDPAGDAGPRVACGVVTRVS
ncbi:superoxide dismutase family protein [Qipengyuania sp. 1NDW9]|uniref:superoxide dismutase family protein n=1 Tax=Qipengyuania xiapuensis TaxID=2867236 RepID=UPI001C87896A|nr:superoxide dismutase family protein [Qipengyuania xiapuensis]MBX7494182.1 superoxide dismutase family protein [Qipengyuania xiapuensis]